MSSSSKVNAFVFHNQFSNFAQLLLIEQSNCSTDFQPPWVWSSKFQSTLFGAKSGTTITQVTKML